MTSLSNRARRIAARIEELEQRHDGEQPRTSVLAELTDNDNTYRYNSVTVTREPDETEADFYRRTCSAFGVDSAIGLIGVKPGDIARGPNGRIDAAALSDEVLRELLDAKRRVEAKREFPTS